MCITVTKDPCRITPMLNDIMCCLILTHNRLELGTTHELMMHTRFAKSEEPHIWSEFTQKGRLGCISSSLYIINIGDLVACIVLHIIWNEPNTLLHSTFYIILYQHQFYQSFTELNEKDTSFELRTHISLSTLIPLRDSHF